LFLFDISDEIKESSWHLCSGCGRVVSFMRDFMEVNITQYEECRLLECHADVSEERNTSIISVTRIGELRTTLAESHHASVASYS
jgi:hypothetical protein